MTYSKQTWANGSAGGTPLSAARLNVMEGGIEAALPLAEWFSTEGLPIRATSATEFEAEATTRARFGLAAWSGRRRWVSVDYPGHTAPTSPAAGDLWDDIAADGSDIRRRRWSGTAWGGTTTVAKPGADNTGHTAAALDGTLTGSQFISTAGTLIENKTINGKVVVTADNVTLRNCYIRGGTTSEIVEFRNPGGLIEDCTIEPTDPTAVLYNGIRGHNFTARRVEIKGTIDGFSLYNTTLADPLNVLIENCWVHDLYFGPDAGQADGNSHNDGVQILSNGGCEIRYNNSRWCPRRVRRRRMRRVRPASSSPTVWAAPRTSPTSTCITTGSPGRSARGSISR